MLKQYIFLSFILVSFKAFSQQFSLTGIVVNDQGTPVEYATVALMNPKDTTLENFSFTNQAGNFEVKNVVPATYLFQISFVGYKTYDTLLAATPAMNDLGIFVLQTRMNSLDAVTISGERTPLQMKGDTIEYNAAAFKTQSDASAEDLLKKLPGVEVDQSGNIKAQGEDVHQVLVDGKEFFSNDPAVATKNLPADAIDKIQVYDKSSDESEFTGVDDGERNKTINLMLKEGKKSMLLGSAEAGGGTDDRYEFNSKVYRFTKENQLAALGMLNNINQFGFSINDYIDFNGGIGSMMSGSGFRIETGDDENMPVNFGQQVNGLITSGAGGLNFTHEAVPGNRLNISYLGNGYQKDLAQNIYQENFTPGFNFTTNEENDEITKNYYHRLNFNLRNKPDSMQNFIASGSAALNYGTKSGNYLTENFSSDSLTNALNSETYDNSHNLTGNVGTTYIHKTTGKWKFFKTNANVSGKSNLTENQWNNITQFFDTGIATTDHTFQDNTNRLIDYDLAITGLRILTGAYFFEPSVTGGGTKEILNRSQGSLTDEELPVDSLSPKFCRWSSWVKPGLALKYSTKQTQWKFTLAAEDIILCNTLNGHSAGNKNYIYLLPRFSFEKEIKAGRHIRVIYESEINEPTAIQLLPVTDNINPLSLFTGNPNLKPEYSHSVFFNWMLFDQFTFTSLFTQLRATYTKDKINYSKTINDELSQSLTLMNTPSDYNASAAIDLSTPLRPLKLNMRISLNEHYDRGINYVNEDENIINAFTHSASLILDNRKKEKLDARIGASIDFTQADYSIQTTESGRYITNSYFLELHYTPVDVWRFSVNADIDCYAVQGFNNTTVVPLLQAEITRYILKSNRGAITLKGFDLLNKNTGVTQTGAYNYLQTTESNTIGRYVLLSFKYRINKAEQKSAVNVEIN